MRHELGAREGDTSELPPAVSDSPACSSQAQAPTRLSLVHAAWATRRIRPRREAARLAAQAYPVRRVLAPPPLAPALAGSRTRRAHQADIATSKRKDADHQQVLAR